jgi:hypothetical protein
MATSFENPSRMLVRRRSSIGNFLFRDLLDLRGVGSALASSNSRRNFPSSGPSWINLPLPSLAKPYGRMHNRQRLGNGSHALLQDIFLGLLL